MTCATRCCHVLLLAAPLEDGALQAWETGTARTVAGVLSDIEPPPEAIGTAGDRRSATRGRSIQCIAEPALARKVAAMWPRANLRPFAAMHTGGLHTHLQDTLAGF